MNAKEILNQLTLEEKISLLCGKDFWKTKSIERVGLPSLMMCDGPSGLRKQENENDMLGINHSLPATSYPAACTMANSWDEELEKEVGRHLALEAKDQKIGIVLGPGINIKRNPLCGRNFEYMSEDPLLAGRMGAAFIEGLQSENIACSLKHFACNNQEYNRFTSNSVVDERTLREIYLRGFEIAVKKAKPMTVMSSYPLLNGEHCSDNKKLLNDILRKEWGFDGFVVTDWGGMCNRLKAVVAGNDLMMPGGSDYMEKELLEAVHNQTLDEKYIDDCCERIISLVLKQTEVLKEDVKADYEAHHEFVVHAASQGAVLLKNEKKVLPLNMEEKILVCGAMAKSIRYQGAGSSHTNSYKLTQPLDYLENYIYAEGCDDFGDTDRTKLEELKQKASQVDKIVVFAGLPDRYESEGFDRKNMFMPEGHLAMIQAARVTGKPVAVVLSCGCVVDCNWEENADAILYMGLAGQGAGKAISQLLYGKVNPSGKLTESWPLKYEDVPSSSFYNTQTDALYKEGLFVGYRYYDAANKEVRYPFGYGLSYSTFEYRDMKLEKNQVSITVENTSDVKGQEVVQLYVGLKDSPVINPIRQLKDFRKISLGPHQSMTVTFELNRQSFESYADGWKVIKGEYEISIGSSSRDLKGQLFLEADGETVEQQKELDQSWYRTFDDKVTDEDWKKILEYEYTEPVLEKGKFTLENTVMEMKDYSLVMKIMFKAVEFVLAQNFGGKPDYNNPEYVMMINSSVGGPMRSMMISAGIKGGIFPGLLEMANGHPLKGIVRMFKK